MVIDKIYDNRDYFIETMIKIAWVCFNLAIGGLIAFAMSALFNINPLFIIIIFMTIRFCASKFWVVRD